MAGGFGVTKSLSVKSLQITEVAFLTLRRLRRAASRLRASASRIGTLVLLFATAAAQGAPPGPLEVSVDKARAMLIKEKLGDGIYLFRAPQELEFWTATNTAVIVNDDDVTVFDSCTRAVTARAIIAEIRKITPKPARVLINSHWHQDHWSGNAEYAAAFPGVRIISTSETRAYMARMGAPFFVDEVNSFGITQVREELKTGKLADGSPLSSDLRVRKERLLAKGLQFIAEIESLPRVLPNLVYRNEMTLWSGRREFRLLSLTGDATASTVLYLPGEKILITGDVLVSPEDGQGPPPWTTNSYAISSWVDSLRRLEALDTAVIVPGQGPPMRDKSYLRRTIELFIAVISQVHAALDRGLVRLADVRAAVNVERIGLEYTSGATKLSEDFHPVVDDLAKKAMQEALDGAADIR